MYRFTCSSNGGSRASTGSFLQCSVTPWCFSFCLNITSCISVCARCLLSHHRASLRRACLHFFCPIRYLCTLLRSPEPPQLAQLPQLVRSSTGLIPACPCQACLGSPEQARNNFTFYIIKTRNADVQLSVSKLTKHFIIILTSFI